MANTGISLMHASDEASFDCPARPLMPCRKPPHKTKTNAVNSSAGYLFFTRYNTEKLRLLLTIPYQTPLHRSPTHTHVLKQLTGPRPKTRNVDTDMGSRAHPTIHRVISGFRKNTRAHPPHVDGRAVLLTAETQLWRPVPSRHHRRGHVPPGAAVGSREPEIGQLHLAVACVQQVVGLQILWFLCARSSVGQRGREVQKF